MTGRIAFEAWGNIDPKYILEAAPDAEITPAGAVADGTPAKREKRPPLHSGWVAAILCLLVGVSIYGGMLWLGRDSGKTPVGGTQEGKTTQGEQATREEVTFEDREPEYTDPRDFTFEITGMEIELTYLRTEYDETDGCLVDVYHDGRNVEYRFFSGTRVLKRFLDEEKRITEDSCAFETVVENARQVVYDHAWLFWSHNHEAILEKKADNTYIYERTHSIDNRFDKESLSMAFNASGQLYAYTYEDHGFFSQCVARSNVDLFMEIYDSLPAGWGSLAMDREDRLCYVCEEIVYIPEEEWITDEDGYLIGPGDCGDHDHVFTSLPILSINPPEKPPLPEEMIYGFSYQFNINNQMSSYGTVRRGVVFVVEGGMSFDADFDTKTYGGSEELFPTVVLMAEDGTVIHSSKIGGYSQLYDPASQQWIASRLFEIPADAPTGKYDVKISYGRKSEIHQDVLTVTE